MGAVLGVLAVLVTATGALLHAANAAAGRTAEPSFWLMGVAAGLGYGVLALAVRRTRGPLPWVVAGIGLAEGASVLTSELALADPTGTTATWATWLGSWLWAPAYVAIVAVLPLLLPDGSLPSRRWRPALVLGSASVLLVAAGWALTPYDAQDFPDALAAQTNPVGTDLGATLLGPAGGALLVAAVGTAVVGVVLRFRRSRGLVRQQLKWILLGVLATVVLMAISRLAPLLLTGAVAALAMLPLPVAVGVAVLRHGLWDVDVVLSRTLRYTLLGGAAAAGFAALSGLFAVFVADEAGVAVLAAAAVSVAVVVGHDAVRRRVNRLVHGREEEPYAVLAEVGDRLAVLEPPQPGATDRGDQVLALVADAVAQGLRADHVAVALADGSVQTVGDPHPEAPTLEVPLAYAGEPVGNLEVQRRGGFGWTDRAVLDRLATQVQVAGRTVLLERAARAAHERTVLAREEERRRVRHDLHDGIGPSLAALALQVETARDIAADDPAAAAAVLDRLVPRLNAAVADVRALVHELRPPTLDELGLASAVRELGARLSTRGTRVVTVSDDLGDLPAAVEVAVYRIAGEAVTNAVRHAAATRVEVTLRRTPQALTVEVCDDGRGLPPVPRPGGVGLSSMRLRAEELGGTLALGPVRLPDDKGAPAGGGTCVTATVPVHGEAADTASPDARPAGTPSEPRLEEASR